MPGRKEFQVISRREFYSEFFDVWGLLEFLAESRDAVIFVVWVKIFEPDFSTFIQLDFNPFRP